MRKNQPGSRPCNGLLPSDLGDVFEFHVKYNKSRNWKLCQRKECCPWLKADLYPVRKRNRRRHDHINRQEGAEDE